MSCFFSLILDSQIAWLKYILAHSLILDIKFEHKYNHLPALSAPQAYWVTEMKEINVCRTKHINFNRTLCNIYVCNIKPQNKLKLSYFA